MKFACVATILAVFANMKVSVASETESGGPGARPATDLVLVQIERAKQYGVVSQNTESLPTFGQDLQVLKSISKSLRGGVTSDHGDSGDDNGDITFEVLHDVNVPNSVLDDVDRHQDGALDVDRAAGELTVKESEGWAPWDGCIHGNNLPGGRYCGTCGNSACSNNVCYFAYCRDCSSDSHCPSGKYCDLWPNYRCEDKLYDGTACNQDRSCQSGNCVVGFCCDYAVVGDCDYNR